MLYEAVLLQITVLCSLLALVLLVGWVEFWLVVDHVVERELSKVKLLGLDELLLKL